MEGDHTHIFLVAALEHFNPLPPHGGRPKRAERLLAGLIFQSTPSAWRETSLDVRNCLCVGFQSTPSAWRETAFVVVLPMVCAFQSTPSAWRETSPLADGAKHHPTFQSTPSAWRETPQEHLLVHNAEISIHSLRMEGDSATT